MERKNRIQTGNVNQQMYGGPPIVDQTPDIFGQAKTSAKIEQSRRDQIWQQKMQQNLVELPIQQQNSYKPFELPQATAAVELDLPIFNKNRQVELPEFNFGGQIQIPSGGISQIQRDFQEPKGSPNRTSMTAQRLQQAKKLDSSINIDEYSQPQERLVNESKPPVHSKPSLSPLVNNQKQKVMDQGILQVLGNNEVDRARREEAKKMVQDQYNQYLAQQNQRKVGNIYEGDGFLNIGGQQSNSRQRVSSATRQNADSSLIIAGMQQMSGLMQNKNPDEERLRRLQEYREIALQNQLMAAAKKEQPVSQEQRRRQLVDQVFDEVVDSSRNQKAQPAPLPPRQWSGVNKRQAEMQKLQNQSEEDPFFKARLRQEEQKRVEQEKKREYAAILNQQMEAKRQRETHSQPQINQQQPNFMPTQQAYQHPAFQPQHLPTYMPTHQSQIPGQMPLQTPSQHMQMPQQMPFHSPSQMVQQIMNAVPGFGQQNPFQPQQLNFNQPQQIKQSYHTPMSQPENDDQFFGQRKVSQADPKLDQYRQQEEYRLELQRQIEMRDQLKRQEPFDLPKSIHDGPKVTPPSRDVQPGSRQRTDVTKVADQFDPVKEQKRLKYQEELRLQMEEQKRRKDEAKQRDLETDLEIERKLKRQREMMADREKEEILKEGKRDPRELEDRPKRQVRRDQFVTSDENNAVTEAVRNPVVKVVEERVQISQMPQIQPMNNFEPMEPAKKSSLDLFAKPEQLFQGFEPVRQIEMPEPKRNEFNFQIPQLQAPQAFVHPAFQEDWVFQQREQASKMFEDQQKMIQLYQQALEQILQYRNQYFEQAMQMRENILKEREQLFEYERLKQAQITEIQQLKAVHGQLSNMAQSAHKQKQPILDKNVQSNLNDYINKQKESILNLSRSSAGLAEVIRQNRQMFPDMPKQEGYDMVVSSARVEIPRVTRSVVPYQEEPEDDLQRRVNEIDRHIHSSQENGIYGASNIEDFEKSLSAESKLVRVPQNNLSAKAQRIQEISKDASNYYDLMATWKEGDTAREERPQSTASPMRIGRHFQEQRMTSSEKSTIEPTTLQIATNTTPKNKLLGKLIGNTSKSPLNSSAMPHTIEELPYENEEDKVLQSSSIRVHDLSPRPQRESKINHSEARFFSEQDFNNRDSPSERSPHKQADFQSNLKTIERMINQQSMPAGQSGFNERKQTTTGSSFYDKTLHNEKIQQAHQQEEVHKQMMRIFGNTSQSYHQPSFEPQPIQEHVPGKFEQAFNGLQGSQQKSSTLILRKSNERLEPAPFRAQRQEHAPTTTDLIAKGEQSIDGETVWDDPDLVPPPVFPSYCDENSQEMIVENNSSNAGTLLEHRQLQLRSNILSDEQNYMGGMGLIPDSAFNTLSPPDYRRPTIAHQDDSEEIVDETVEQEDPSQERSPDVSQNLVAETQANETKQSIQSSKKMYMDEITELIKKATSQAGMAVQAAEMKRRSPFVPYEQQILPTPHFVQSERTVEGKTGNNDQILADLDKIISNLEAQQKNMQTFGIQKLEQLPESDEDEMPETIQEEPTESITQSTNRRWKTLKDARDAKRIQTEEPDRKMVTIGRPGRAPLDPKSAPRPKSGKSAKSRGSQKRSTAGDPSPQRVGKYTQLALQNTSQSPMRVGKYTNMALQNSPVNALSDNSVSKSPSALKSPQRLGKYAAMALNNSQLNRSGVSGQSPSRIGKFAMMALQNQREMPDVDNMSQKYSRALSGSRERQKSVERQTLVQQLENDIDNKLGFDNNENVVNNGQPILRPLSSVSKSSRYNTGSQAGQPISSSIVIAPEFRSNTEGFEDGQTKMNFRNTGNIRTDVKIYGNGKPMQVAQYFSDDEEEPRPLAYQNSASGRTEITEQLRKVRDPRINQE